MTDHPAVKWIDSMPDGMIRSVLDLGCGDVAAIASCQAIVRGSVRYFGVDCDPGLVRHHLRVFPWFRGVVADVEAEPVLMRRLMRVDVVIAIGVLEMLCNGAASTVLDYIARGSWKWLIVSSSQGVDNARRSGLRLRKTSKDLDVMALGVLRDEPVAVLDGGALLFHRENLAPENRNSVPSGERFFILCRDRNERAITLARQLSAFGESVIVEDSGRTVRGYEGITNLGKSTAWDLVFHGIDPSRPAWFIEDDVACRDWSPVVRAGSNAGVDLVAMDCATREDSGDWPWWPRDTALPKMAKSFNPVCRLSAELIERVLQYRATFGSFQFHEFMFAGLARSVFDLRREIPGAIGAFRWRPEITDSADTRLQHPVKDSGVHLRIST